MYGVIAFVLSALPYAQEAEGAVSAASSASRTATTPVLELLEGAARGVAGLIRAVSDGVEWTQNIWGLIPINELKTLLNLVSGGIAGAFDLIADMAGGFASVFEFMQGQTGLEAAAFLVGLFIMFLGVWLVISGILEGEALLLPLYENDLFFAFSTLFMGTGLVIYSVSPIGGSAMVAGISVSVTFFGIQADEAEFVVMGVFSGLFGFPMLFTTIGFGAIEAGFLSAIALVGLIYGADLLETRIAPEIAGE